ncbi:MAG: hypothetical protein LBL16_03860 [Endomicrobium sp.]|jgi:hypothetical protein|nr:hypothetical protein [Endomicrobium sp.]
MAHIKLLKYKPFNLLFLFCVKYPGKGKERRKKNNSVFVETKELELKEL